MNPKKKDGTGVTRRISEKPLDLPVLPSPAPVPRGPSPARNNGAGAKAATVPKRNFGKTGADVSMLSLGGMFDT